MHGLATLLASGNLSLVELFSQLPGNSVALGQLTFGNNGALRITDLGFNVLDGGGNNLAHQPSF